MSFKTYTHHTVYPSLDDRGGGRGGAGRDLSGGIEAYQLSQCLAQKIVLGESLAEVLRKLSACSNPHSLPQRYAISRISLSVSGISC
jgi:hypothetical protein